MTVDAQNHVVPKMYFKMPSLEVIKYFNDFWIDTNTTELPEGCHYKLYPQRSRGQGCKGSYVVFLPPSYDHHEERRYPVMYWLHGGMQNQRQSFGAIEFYSGKMREGLMPETIIISVQALPVGWYADSLDGSRPIATIITSDLVPHVDNLYHTIAHRSHRWIEGFSMGGYGTLHLGFKYPHLFGALSAIAPALLEDMTQEPLERTQDTFFGSTEYYHQSHPFQLMKRNRSAILGRTRVRVLSGSDDSRLTEVIVKFKKLLVDLDLPHDEIEVPNVDHEYLAILLGTQDHSYRYWGDVLSAAEKAAPNGIQGNGYH